jgi:nucleotide-binding universal stress UspA family protein
MSDGIGTKPHVPAAAGRIEGGERVIVGTDGSENARNASTWAAGEAVRRNASLTLAHAFYLTIDSAYVPGPTENLARQWEAEARKMIDSEVDRLSSRFPGLAIGTATDDGQPAAFLTALSQDATLVVTGTRGHGGFTGMLVGSVSRKLSAHAQCPLVVVGGGEPRTDVRNEIVLGVGHKPSPASIRFAFDAAARYDATLTVLRAWWPLSMYGGFAAPGGMYVDHYDIFRTAARAEAERAVEPFRLEYPGVEVEFAPAEGNTVPALVDAAHDARMLVVGAHRDRGPLSVGAGYVVDGAVAHSATPVAVVPAE